MNNTIRFFIALALFSVTISGCRSAVATTTDNAALVQRAKGALFEVENLQIGCTAPDIVAKDTDGNAMKLSEYRGKVILLP